MKTLSLSIVIPAYNEERYLKKCLDSIARQTVKPDEVIVVDNNSTDKTSEIARSYPFVKLLTESRQSQVFAQKTGFDTVTCDIIGRIDADSSLPTTWVEKIKTAFQNDPDLVGLTGGPRPYDVQLQAIAIVVFNFYNWLASVMAGNRMLWGANCAVRQSAWLKVSDQVFQRADVWEDYDLTFCLAPLGKLVRLKNIDVGTSFRAVHKSVITQTRYQFRSVRTFYLRTNLVKAVMFGLLWSTMYPLYIPVLIDSYVIKPFKKLASK